MKIKWDSVLTTVLVACAVVTTGLVVYRELFAGAARPPSQAAQKPVFIEEWRSHLVHGERFGSADAPVQLMEFADFECPFCGSFHETLKAVRARYSGDVALTYVHFPLPGHRFAIPAARAVECAGRQGRFEAMHDRLFEGQQLLGLKPWTEYAAEAGVQNLPDFSSCVESTEAIARVEAGQRLGAQLDVQGTPTLIINGWKLGRPPTADELDEMIEAVLAGKNPVSVE